ncbi:MAG: phosphopeptide-binding protein [Thalassobius sp.]|nr:phosphopeptide-binding protein [Thalassovita sp.]
MKNYLVNLLTVLSLFFYACSGQQTNNAQEESDTTETTQETTASTDATVMEKDGIKIYPASSSPEFPDAKLELNAPTLNETLTAGSNTFDYTVTNYELGAQTTDASQKDCANSGKGQHIHLILNNEPYIAKYENKFDVDLKDGHYVALSFISRSYHESIKTDDAYVLTQFNVGSATDETDLSQPLLFYSRPKGEYSGDDTKKLLLDFYLVNTDISASGNKVKATINGSTEFMFDTWTPYFVEGLPMGDNTIKLELVDGEGNPVGDGFNTIERTFKLSQLN